MPRQPRLFNDLTSYEEMRREDLLKLPYVSLKELYLLGAKRQQVEPDKPVDTILSASTLADLIIWHERGYRKRRWRQP